MAPSEVTVTINGKSETRWAEDEKTIVVKTPAGGVYAKTYLTRPSWRSHFPRLSRLLGEPSPVRNLWTRFPGESAGVRQEDSIRPGEPLERTKDYVFDEGGMTITARFVDRVEK